MENKARRLVSLVLVVGLFFQQAGLVQAAGALSLAGYLNLSGSSALSQDRFRPVQMRYFSYEPASDNFKILLDKGDLNKLEDKKAREEAQTLLSYFLVGVALPDDTFWVNLRPDSQDQIIDPLLEKTDVGRIMLAADIQLKKDISSLTSPQTPEGRKYWDKLYQKAGEFYGHSPAQIPTITRPWIVPGEIIVRESQNSAYVYKAGLKVMLEEDYLTSRGGSRTAPTHQQYAFPDPRLKELNQYSTQLIKELIIPKLTKEINSSKKYANLRQVYYSLILSRWFKLRFSGKSGTYSALINTRNLTNLTSQNPWDKSEYFNQYQQSFAKGEYNLKEQVATPMGQIARSYVSGGVNWASSAINPENGVMLSKDNAHKLGEIIKGKAVVDFKKVILESLTDYSSEKATSSSIIEINNSRNYLTSVIIGDLTEEKEHVDIFSLVDNLIKKNDIPRLRYLLQQAKVTSGTLVYEGSYPDTDPFTGLIVGSISRYNGQPSFDHIFKIIFQVAYRLRRSDIIDMTIERLKQIIEESYAELQNSDSYFKQKLAPAIKKIIRGEISKIEEYKRHITSSPVLLDQAPVLWLEIASERNDYLNNLQEIKGISDIFEEISRKNENGYLMDILEGALNHPGIQGNVERKEAITNLIRQRHGDFPLKNIAYQALIEMVRAWPKKDRHTHVTASIPIENALNKLKALGQKPAFIEKLKKVISKQIDDAGKKGLYSVAIKDFKGLLDKSGLEDITLDQFSRIIQSSGGREVKDAWMKALEGDELEDAVIDEILTAVQQNFTDGVTDLEIRFNPFKDGIPEDYDSVSNLLAKLTEKIKEVEENFHAIFRQNYHTAYIFSLSREKMMRESSEKDEKFETTKSDWENKFRILIKLIKGQEKNLYTGRLKGIDIAGTEPFVWQGNEQKTIQDVNNNFALDWLVDKLRKLKESGYEITMHLGDFAGARPQDNPDGRAAFINAHLEKLNGVIGRIGHGRMFTPGKIRIWDKPIGGKDYWEDNTLAGKKLLKTVKEMNPVPVIESTPEFDTLSMDMLRDKYPNYWWCESEFKLDVVYGSDGLYTARPVTLSQWLVRLLLASPTPNFSLEGRTSGITVKQMKEVVIDHKAGYATEGDFHVSSTGGIDFRALSMSVQPMGSFRGLDFGLPRLSRAEIERIDVEFQIGQINDMVRSGISPSGRRVKELVAACAQKGQINAYADDLLACIGDILKLEEETARESSVELKEALVLADLGGNYFQL